MDSLLFQDKFSNYFLCNKLTRLAYLKNNWMKGMKNNLFQQQIVQV